MTKTDWLERHYVMTLAGVDEIRYLRVPPGGSIELHGHNEQWQVWLDVFRKTAYVCVIGEEHELVNNTSGVLHIMEIAGRIDYPYDDLTKFFYYLGFSVTHGSLVVNEEPEEPSE